MDIRQTVRSECVLTVWCYVTTQLLNPEAILTLTDTWKDVNTILNKISALKVSPSDKHKQGIDVLTADFRETLDTISVQGSVFDQGSRQSFIAELDSLMSRLNIYQADGVTVD